MNDSQRLPRLVEAIEHHPDVLQAIVSLAREMGEFPSTKHLETDLWPSYSNRLRREEFRCLCRDLGSLFSPPEKHIATGFHFEPLPHGSVLICFFGDGPTPINEQIISPDVLRRMPVVAALLDVAVKKGPETAREFLGRLNHEGK